MCLTTQSDMYCTQCGKKGIPVQRNKGRQREPGHLKKMFCVYCQKEQNMVEVKNFGGYSLNDFLIEFENHNFNENGQRIMTYSELKQKLIKKGE